MENGERYIRGMTFENLYAGLRVIVPDLDQAVRRGEGTIAICK